MEPTIQSMGAWLGIWHLEILLGAVVLIGAIAVILSLCIYRRMPTGLNAELSAQFAFLESCHQQLRQTLQNELAANRQEASFGARQAREELSQALMHTGDALLRRMTENAGMQKDQLDSFSKQLDGMTRLHDTRFEGVRQALEKQLRSMREDNQRQLELMRTTVDEKLQNTLEARLGESFRQVSERLEQVYKGLGEMRSLASGVGDLKKVLTNVKTRGTWGEISLNRLLEQILIPEQYAGNVAVNKGSQDRVDFAVKLPGPSDNGGQPIWLPIDAKFPQEDYQRLLEAQEAADRDLAEKSIKRLEARMKAEAKTIRDKYINPPQTTDFAVMFLPVEGLYAEVLRLPGLCDGLQREYRVAVAGPTTLAALLNSLQMGFRTLAIEKRSAEVWDLLGGVKNEFSKFGDVLARTKKKLQEASNTIDHAEVRTRAIERKLRNVQDAPQANTGRLPESAEGSL